MNFFRIRTIVFAQLDRVLFVLFVLSVPFQVRFLFRDFGDLVHNEWTQGWIWASDIALLLFFVASIARMRPKFARPQMAMIFCLGFFVWYAAASALGLDRPLGLWTTAKLAECIILFFVVRGMRERLTPNLVFIPLAVISLFEALVALAQFFSQRALGLGVIGESPIAPDASGVAKFSVAHATLVRAYGLAPHPNVLAAILMCGLLAFVWFLVTADVNVRAARKRIKLIVLSMGIFVVVLALGATFSRALWVFGALALLFFFAGMFVYCWQRENLRRTAFAFAVLIASLAATSVVFWPEITARLAIAPQDQAITLRHFYGRIAVRSIQESPLLGLGGGNFVEHLVSREGSVHFAEWLLQPVHNIYLLIAAEAGIPALFLFVFFLGTLAWQWGERFARASGTRRVTSLAYMSGALFMLGAGFFDHFPWTLQQGRLLLWLFLGLL